MANHGSHTESRFRASHLSLIAVALLVILFCVVYLNERSHVDNTLRLATTHQPIRYSELFFTNYSALPKTVKVGKKYNVPFTIANHEGENFSYSYQATITEKGKTTVLPVERVEVSNGGEIQQSVSFSARSRNDLVEVNIKLLNPDLQIHYKALS